MLLNLALFPTKLCLLNFVAVFSSSSCLLWSLHLYMLKLKLRPTTLILSHATLAQALGIKGCHSRENIIKFHKQIAAWHSVMLSSIQSTQLIIRLLEKMAQNCCQLAHNWLKLSLNRFRTISYNINTVLFLFTTSLKAG